MTSGRMFPGEMLDHYRDHEQDPDGAKYDQSEQSQYEYRHNSTSLRRLSPLNGFDAMTVVTCRCDPIMPGRLPGCASDIQGITIEGEPDHCTC